MKRTTALTSTFVNRCHLLAACVTLALCGCAAPHAIVDVADESGALSPSQYADAVARQAKLVLEIEEDMKHE
jgi:hypothetical protein